MEENNTITFYTDGAYSGSKKKGGWALYSPQYNLRICHGEMNTTNNRMEMMAVIKALEFVVDSNIPEKHIVIISDSKYVIETMKGNYQKKTNLDLWDKMDMLVSALFAKTITWKHVKGHTGLTAGNDVVDHLANLVSQI